MRILHAITPSRLSGAELLVLRLCVRQQQAGHDVCLVTKPIDAVVDRARTWGLDVIAAPLSGKFNARALPVMLSACRTFMPDLVMTHLSTASLWGSLAARRCGIPSVAMVHGFTHGYWYRVSDALVCVSYAVADHMRSQGVSPRRLWVVHNGVEPEAFGPAEPASIPIPADVPCVGTVSHLSPKKGLRELVAAAELVPQATFAVAGEGILQDRLLRESRARLDGRLCLLGWRDDIYGLMRRFRVFCLPSRREPFGLVLLEAMAASLPVVAFRAGGVPEVVEHGVTGLLAEPGDVRELAAHLRALLSDPERAAAMGSAGRARVSEHFMLDRTVSQIQTVIDGVLAERRQ